MVKKFNLLNSAPKLWALGGGILMGLAPAPINAWYTAWFALTPLWLLIRNRQRSFKEIFLLALLWGGWISWLSFILANRNSSNDLDGSPLAC